MILIFSTLRKLPCLLALIVLAFTQATAHASTPVSGGGTLSYNSSESAQQCSMVGYSYTYTYSNFSYTSANGTNYPLSGSYTWSTGPIGAQCSGSGQSAPPAISVSLPLPSTFQGGGCFISDTFSNFPGSPSLGCPPPSYQGYLDPKYLVVGVTYAPPGPSSFVQYTSGITLATTKSTSSSFSNGSTVSVSIGTKSGIQGWAAGNVTISNSNTVTQASGNSSSVTLSLATQLATKTPGTPNAYSPVAHDYDIIWLWLNPVALYTVIPSEPNVLTWNGYGYDTTDQPAIDIWPVYVGYLNGDFGALDPGDAQVLARSWAAGQTWPSGQGPGLTQTDFNQILQADPFANSSYSVVLAPNTSPATTTDGRYTISGGSGGTAQSFDYKQALPGDPPINQTFQNTYSSNSTLGQSATTTTQETFGIDASYTGGIFATTITYDLKYSQTLIWTDLASTSTSSTVSQIDSLDYRSAVCHTHATLCACLYRTA